MKTRIGTIIHGALGDCYEQLLCLKTLKKDKNAIIIGFFVMEDRLRAMQHFYLDMLDEIYLAADIDKVNVDYFYQYQIKDLELNEMVLDKLPRVLRAKFDFSKNIKPWNEIRSHDFKHCGLALSLSSTGENYLPICMKKNEIDSFIFDKHFTVGYLWRYRHHGGAVKPYFQRSKEWILKTKTELFKKLIEDYNAHILICGMGKDINSPAQNCYIEAAGLVLGEYLSKYSQDHLDLPRSSCTYLKGLGYAAEMAIMSRCDLLLMMPSGFSEPLWMMRKAPVVMLDPPPIYVAKLLWNRMPLFDNNKFVSKIFNLMVPHTAGNVFRYLDRRGFLPTIVK